jgi:uncharacterized protein (DUF1697 family)
VTRHIVLSRGINLAGRNRIAMPELREALTRAGFDDVSTYLQSGNVVLSSDAPPDEVARACRREIADRFGFDIAVVVRSLNELAGVVKRNPLAGVAIDPKRYQVTFLDGELAPDIAGKLEALPFEGEEFVVDGREIYAWHPDGVGRSKLASFLVGRRLGVTGTARNWTTVTKLLELADA